MQIQRIELAGLTTRIVGPADASQTVILLHGFGAPGDDLVALAQMIHAPARFVFPAAPLELGGLNGDSRAPVSWDQAGGTPVPRAWWLLDLVQLEEELRSGRIRDRRSEVPAGLVEARTQVMRLIDQLKARFGIDDAQLVLGGFSQGAMLSLDVALHRDTPPAALVLMSGTLLAENEWTPRLPKLAGVRVFQSHGRNDALLPFSIAELLRDQLRAAGARLEWCQFIGGHEITPMVLEGVARLLRDAATGSTSP